MNSEFLLLVGVGAFAFLQVVLSIDRDDIWYLCPTDAGDYCDFDPDCSLIDGAYRAGYFCDTFPWYSGGEWPTEWKDEDEYYTCQEFHISNITGNITECEKWSANEYSGDELEFGECQCFEYSDNEEYCKVWACYQTNDGYENLNFEICSDDDSTYTYEGQTFDTYCAQGNIEYELLRCFCYSPDISDRYCTEWVCEQYDIDKEGNEDYSETERYRCEDNSPPENSPYYGNADYTDSNFCWQWVGDINSEKEFELTDCECRATNSKEYCSDWYCYEKGMNKYRNDRRFGAALGWSIAGTVVCIASTLLCGRICNPRNRTCVYCVVLFTFSLFSVICIFVGGVASWMIWFVIWFGLLQYFWVFRPTNSCFGWDEICGCDPFALLGMSGENEDGGEGAANKRKQYDVDGREIRPADRQLQVVNQNSHDPRKPN